MITAKVNEKNRQNYVMLEEKKGEKTKEEEKKKEKKEEEEVWLVCGRMRNVCFFSAHSRFYSITNLPLH